jgi:L-asparaginase/Glu-tRNA(Gln) amidotransferase subunit D
MNVKKPKKIVVLATGGTIAGWANDVGQPQHYKAGQVSAADLLADIQLDGHDVVTEQVAQVDSKDMSVAIWQSLLSRLTDWLAQDDVQGVVITHGTDTVEETAYFLSAVLPNYLRLRPVSVPQQPAMLISFDSKGRVALLLETPSSWLRPGRCR